METKLGAHVTYSRNFNGSSLRTSLEYRIAAVALFVLFSVVSFRTRASSSWCQGDSVGDQSIACESLGNGMRIAIMQHSNPQHYVSFRLTIAAGTLSERSGEEGMAHLVEHMAFRGSSHFPEGEMLRRLTKLGIAVGPDVNAQTREDQTVYKINLPSNDYESMSLALDALRDVVGEVSIDQSAIDSELRVIGAEKRLRESPEANIANRRGAFVMSACGAEERPVLGESGQLKSASATELSLFYHRAYRPSAATLVVVGDVDTESMRTQIVARYSDWADQGQADVRLSRLPDDASFVKAQTAGSSTGNHVHLYWLSDMFVDGNSSPHGRNKFAMDIALALFNWRVRRSIDANLDNSIVDASAVTSRWGSCGNVTEIDASFSNGNWRDTIRNVETTRRRVLASDFSERQINAVREQMAEELRNRIVGTAAVTNSEIADWFVERIGEHLPLESPDHDAQNNYRDLYATSPGEVRNSLRAMFHGGRRLIWVTATALKAPGASDVLSAVMQADVVPVRSLAKALDPTWPYSNFGSVSPAPTLRYVPSIDSTFAMFQNGVRLAHKKTPSNGQIEVRIGVSGGLLGLNPQSHFPVFEAENGALIDGGLREIDHASMELALAGRKLGSTFSVTENSFEFSATTTAKDLRTQLELFAAYITSAAYRPSAFARAKLLHLEVLRQLDQEPLNALRMSLPAIISDDPRWQRPTLEQVRKSAIKSLRNPLAKAFEHAPINIVVVGDIDLKDVVSAATATFGALGSRRHKPFAQIPAKPFPSSSRVVTVSTGDRGNRGAAAIVWPTTSMFSDLGQYFDLMILGDILNNKLVERIRSQLGISYAVRVAAYSPEAGPPSRGVITVEADVAASGTQDFITSVNRIVSDVQKGEISDDDFQRAQDLSLNRMNRALRTNQFWAHWLIGADEDPRRTNYILNSVAVLKGRNKGTVADAALRYLDADNRLTVLAQ